MILILEVTSPQAGKLGAGSRKVFGPGGGLIGRDKSSSWVLPHTKVSGRHAVITYRNGVFYIEDTSTNGVFVNSSKSRLVRGRPYALKSGDSLFIDPYVIEVTVSSEAEDVADRMHGQRSDLPPNRFVQADPFNLDDDLFGERKGPQPIMSPDLDPGSGQEVDPLKLLDPEPRNAKPAAPRKVVSAQDLELSSPLRGYYKPPAVATPTPPPTPAPSNDPFMIPADYDPLGPDEPRAAPPAPPSTASPRSVPDIGGPALRTDAVPEPPSAWPVPPSPFPETPALETGPRDETPLAAPRQPASPPKIIVARPTPAPEAPRSTLDAPAESDTLSVDLGVMLAGAGFSREDMTPELARNFGQILRVVVSGVMEVLRARQQIKDEFRMRMTQFKPADNNPLKFSANVDDALHNLLVKRNPAYLDAVEAFEDAFDDLRNHQIAMLAGMRTAFESMLAEFHPDRLQEQFDRQLKRGSLLGVPAKLRYWDLYRDRNEDLAKDPEATFRELFGEEFAKEYEAQLQRLKAARRVPGAPGRGPQE